MGCSFSYYLVLRVFKFWIQVLYQICFSQMYSWWHCFSKVKILVLIKPNLFFFFHRSWFVSYILKLINILKSNMDFLIGFLLKIFMIMCPIFRLIHLSLLLYKWISSCFRIICWKDYPISTALSLPVAQEQLTTFLRDYLWVFYFFNEYMW